VRSLAADPRDPDRIYLGTADGVLYRSQDGGRRWERLSPGFPKRGMSLDEILVDPSGNLLVGYWEVAGKGGGVARSSDGGVHFTLLPGIEGESVRALAAAPGRPQVLVAGALSGVFRSADGGETWSRVSPPGHQDLRNVESVAIDPLNPEVFYAGTWHLPWKTGDAGRSWRPAHAGMIDDSDVMTLTVDRRSRQTVYATACSGIYRSADGAARWSKIRGIPGTSRRTRAFAQDPEQPATFFAGTTEGLWRSRDDLGSWSLVTPRELVVNALLVLPGGAVLAGTDGAGVLRSEDHGSTWQPSNAGFAERFVSQLLFDGPRLVVGLLGDRHQSGVLVAPRFDGPWTKLARGLEGRELASLALVPSSDGSSEALAGTDRGLYLSVSHCGEWRALPLVVDGIDENGHVAAVAAVGPRLFLAGTERGLLRSDDGGQTWTRRVLGLASRVTALAVSPRDRDVVLAATRLGLHRSADGGRSWEEVAAAPLDVPVGSLQFLPDGQGVLGTSTRGLVLSRDQGRSWMRRGGGLPLSNVPSVAALPDGRSLVASDFDHAALYLSRDGGQNWERLPDTGLPSTRVFAVAADPTAPERVVAAPTSGGLHVLQWPSVRGPAAAAAGSH
jgi:photosystem II stability/assembly factor-like uncharacterized protein